MTFARVAVLTPAGRGAIASLLMVGAVELLDRHRLFVAVNGRGIAEQDIGRICLGHWGAREDRLPSEQIVACRTGSERVELHCHGGAAAVARILDDLAEVGVERSEWTGLVAGPSGRPARRVEIEVAEALAAATTWRTAAILLDQHSGVLVQLLERLAAVDWDQRDQVAGPLDELLEWSGVGRQLANPPTVVLAGAPNVGKSSLLNALLGFGRAIVWNEPGTTRDVISGHTALEGWPVRLVDTAGLRVTDDEIEVVGIKHARRELDAAELVLLVVDCSQPIDDENRQLMSEWNDAVVVANKCDLPDATGGALPGEILSVSALTGEGIDGLAAAIAARLVPRMPGPGTAVPVSTRLVECLEAAARAIADGEESAFRAAMAEAIG